MPDDPDDLDAGLRRAMASLDRQVPPGYFEALPARTLARLDDPAIGAPAGDAGLQDIRDLASETRARLSSQRAAQGAPLPGAPSSLDDDAATSSVWKAVALPGPMRSAAPADDAGPEPAHATAAARADASPASGAASGRPVDAGSPPQVGAVSQPPIGAGSGRPVDAGSPPPVGAVSQPPVSAASVSSVSAVSRPPISAAGVSVGVSTAVSQPPRPAPPLSPTAASAADSSAGGSTARRGRRAAWVATAGGLAAAGVVGYLSLVRRAAERTEVAAITAGRTEPVTTTRSADPAGGRPDEPSRAPAAITRGSVEPAAPAAATAPPPTTAMAPTAPTASTASAAGSYGDDLHSPSRPVPRTDQPRRQDDSAGEVRPRPSASQHAEPLPARKATGGAAGPDVIALGKARSIAKRPAGAPPSKAGPAADPLTRGAGAVGAFDSAKPSDPAGGSAAGSGSPSPSASPSAGAGSGSGAAGAPATPRAQQAQIPLDQLLGEQGGMKPAPAKPRPSRTSLSTDDIKRGMTAVAGKAKACFAGTQGLASLRLTVAPSGRVVKVAVTGMFAGSPTGACVERAAGAARFPVWDGGPQSFNYSYLLSD